MFEIAETFVTISKAGVLRGFHFQIPPDEQWKLVTCLSGDILDVVIDLRETSSNFMTLASTVLSGGIGGPTSKSILIPPGFGHAFYTLSEEATVLYQVDRPYNSNSDQGILWSSVNFTWPERYPILSDRDRQFKSLQLFTTPFSHIWKSSRNV